MTVIDYSEFARRWLPERAKFFAKDIGVCIKDFPESEVSSKHAYFPALFWCCATIEFLSSLDSGHVDRDLTRQDIKNFVHDHMDGLIYTPFKIDLLWEAHRHKIAHLAHPQYVFRTVEKPKIFPRQRLRVTWLVDEKFPIFAGGREIPHLHLEKVHGQIRTDPRPRDVKYNRRLYVSLPKFRDDIVQAFESVLRSVEANHRKRRNFGKVVRYLFPS